PDQNAVMFSGSSPRSVPIRNTGDAALAISSIRVTGVDAALFAKTTDSCTGQALAPNSSCEVGVAYQAGGPAGVQSAYLELTDNAIGSPQKIELVGQEDDCRVQLLSANEYALTQMTLLRLMLSAG